MTAATPRRRYPASLSHNPSGPSRPAPHPPSSVGDDKPPAEYTSLEHLLRQAGYKETRVFTPEHERVRPRLKQQLDDNDGDDATRAAAAAAAAAGELADLYHAMGLDPSKPVHVRHLTKPTVPFRSSSSVLRNIVASNTANANTNTSTNTSTSTNANTKPEQPTTAESSWWGTTLRRTVGKTPSVATPSGNGNGNGNEVRKTVSNWELRSPSSQKPETDVAANAASTEFDWNRAPPPSFAELFSPPTTSVPAISRFGDDALAEDVYAYGLGDDSDTPSDGSGSLASSPSNDSQDSPVVRSAGAMSPPLLEAVDVFADLGMMDEAGAGRGSLGDVGRRILASTVDYDDLDELDTPPSPTSTSPVAASTLATFVMPTSSPVKRALQKAAEHQPPAESPSSSPRKPASPQASPRKVRPPTTHAVLGDTPTKVGPRPQRRAASLRAVKSTPALSPTRRRPPPLYITKATAAPPSLHSAAPVVCDSVSNAAEDLPPLPMPPMPESPPPTTSGFSTLTLKARQSLSALRAYWAAAEPAPAPEPEQTADVDYMIATSTAPVLTPRLDWETQGFNAGWSSRPTTSFHKSRDSSDTMAELEDPFLDSTGDIDYTKSFFYKPSTPPRSGQSSTISDHLGEPRRQRSIKSLRAALRIPVAPPVPPIPEKYRKHKSASAISRTPPLPVKRLSPLPPSICIHSPGAYEEGRPARPVDLEGDEYAARDVINNWGKGVRKGRGKMPVGGTTRRRVRVHYDAYDLDV